MLIPDGNTFTFSGDFHDSTPINNSGRQEIAVVGIDATRFVKKTIFNQYLQDTIFREFGKAYVGFLPLFDESQACDNRPLRCIATGNWGCGAFGGDVELKFIIQWLAASLNGRSIKYFTFGDKILADRINMFVNNWNKTCGRDSYGALFQFIQTLNIRERKMADKECSVFELILANLKENKRKAGHHHVRKEEMPTMHQLTLTQFLKK